MKAVIQDMAYVEHANGVWTKAIQARRTRLSACQAKVVRHREVVELEARNKTIQVLD